jgi:late competence protein required for DNA uptake (superfamily II DNA/RNA helicase)
VSEDCCACYFQREQEEAQEYSDYQLVYQQEVKKQQQSYKQLKKLRDYSGCSKCGSSEVDACFLYDKNKLVCQPCLMRKKGRSSSPISFSEQSKWYKK